LIWSFGDDVKKSGGVLERGSEESLECGVITNAPGLFVGAEFSFLLFDVVFGDLWLPSSSCHLGLDVGVWNKEPGTGVRECGPPGATFLDVGVEAIEPGGVLDRGSPTIIRLDVGVAATEPGVVLECGSPTNFPDTGVTATDPGGVLERGSPTVTCFDVGVPFSTDRNLGGWSRGAQGIIGLNSLGHGRCGGALSAATMPPPLSSESLTSTTASTAHSSPWLHCAGVFTRTFQLGFLGVCDSFGVVGVGNSTSASKSSG